MTTEKQKGLQQKTEVDFKTSPYFSGTMIFFGVVLIFVGLLFLADSNLIGVVLLILSVLIFTTHYRFKIDFDNKSYHDYIWIIGIKSGEKGKFETVEYLFVTKSKISQTMNMKSLSTTIKKEVFDGYLKFSPDDKVHLMTLDDKDELLQRLKVISEKMRTRIIDYSEGEPKEI